jgi:hypothetical protein
VRTESRSRVVAEPVADRSSKLALARKKAESRRPEPEVEAGEVENPVLRAAEEAAAVEPPAADAAATVEETPDAAAPPVLAAVVEPAETPADEPELGPPASSENPCGMAGALEAGTDSSSGEGADAKAESAGSRARAGAGLPNGEGAARPPSRLPPALVCCDCTTIVSPVKSSDK